MLTYWQTKLYLQMRQDKNCSYDVKLNDLSFWCCWIKNTKFIPQFFFPWTFKDITPRCTAVTDVTFNQPNFGSNGRENHRAKNETPPPQGIPLQRSVSMCGPMVTMMSLKSRADTEPLWARSMLDKSLSCMFQLHLLWKGEERRKGESLGVRSNSKYIS